MRFNKNTYTFSWPYDEHGHSHCFPECGKRGPLGCATVSHYTQALDSNTTLQVAHKHDFIGLVINLGKSFSIATPGFRLTLGKNRFNLLYLPKGTYIYRFEKGNHSSLTIRVTAEYLKVWEPECAGIIPFLDVARSHSPVSIALSQAVTPDIRLILDYLLKSSYKGEFKKIFFHAKTIDIVHSCLRELGRYSFTSKPRPEVEKIMEAKQVLTKDLQYSWSVDLLGDKVNMNQHNKKTSPKI